MTVTEELAARCGIQDATKDAEGVTRPVDSETKVAILGAMGFAARNDAEAKAGLQRLDAEFWDRAVPPVIVATVEGRPITVPVVLPRATQEFSCTITLEDGTRFYDVIQFSDLPLIAERNDGVRWLQQRSLPIRRSLPFGYHTVRLGSKDVECSLIVAPGKCWLPEVFGKGQRVWGISAQLYLLRSDHNWGIGDFTDLRALMQSSKEGGADVVGVNPLHALFLNKPEFASPYSPSDRLLLNILNIDVEAIPELEQCSEAQQLMASDAFQQKLMACRASKLLDYRGVCELKVACLKLIFDTFENTASDARRLGLDAFRNERRSLLDRACLFQALLAYFVAQDPSLDDPRAWPDGYRTSDSTGAKQFQETHSQLVRFQLWMQWIADTQLRDACAAADGMEIGLYRDLAVGSDPKGSELWSHSEVFVDSAQVGAPPDIWNPAGQNWGLPPFDPLQLKRHAYLPFIELLRANMRYAGALRIDHAMALMRLYWIPTGSGPDKGAYVHYPMEDLLGILALESHRNRCLIVGEDLGTVPEGFRERMTEANVLSYRVLFFERNEQGFLPPDAYPPVALSVASSHDLPTLQGWLTEIDLDAKQRLGLFPEGGAAEKARKQRRADHRALAELLHSEGIVEGRVLNPEKFTAHAHSLLARTGSLLTLVQIDDIAREVGQVNVPSTCYEHPNWRRRLSLPLEKLASDESFVETVKIMRKERCDRNLKDYSA